MTDLEKARTAIREVLKTAADRLKGEGFTGWDEYFDGYECVDFSLTHAQIRQLGDALKDGPPKVGNAQARTLNDLVTPKQLWMIRNLAGEVNIPDVEKYCFDLLDCKLEEISKKAAADLIGRLKAQAPADSAKAAEGGQ
jgi:hypothetical protein